MSHSIPNPYSGRADGSWSTNACSPYPPPPRQLSTPSSWGTVHTKSSLGAATNTPLGPTGSVSNGFSWGSQTTFTLPPHGSWPASPSTSYMGSPGSSATLISPVVPVGVQGLPYLGYPTPLPAPAPAVFLDAALQDGRLGISIAHPPPAHNSLANSAFTPSMTYIQINFEGFPNWILRVHTGHALTVYAVLQHIYHFLQEPDIQDNQAYYPAANSHHQMTYQRDHRASSTHFDSGKKRIAVLGQRTVFVGLTPAGGNNGWTVHFGRASTSC